MRVVFVTTELEPFTPGGTGTTVKLLSDGLASEGHNVTVILVTEKQLDQVPPDVTQVQPDQSDANIPEPLARSRAAAKALAAIVQTETMDLVEFQDLDGLAFATLVDRSVLGLDRTRIGIRMYGSADSRFEPQGEKPDEIAPVRIMEAESYRMADLVVAPSQATRQEAIDRYGLEPNRVMVGQLPIPSEEQLRATLTSAPPPGRADPLAPYKTALVAPRHTRSQSGLATAGVKRLEAASAPPPSVYSRLLRRALRAMPGPLAHVAVRRVPQAIKDRVRRVANWGDEAARRAQQERVAAVRRRIARGDFREIDEPLVTIVIPCFDQGRFLEDALTSIFEQTFPYFEIIVVDDGSSDPDTIAYLDRLDWPRVQLVRQENRGAAAARNVGMALARAPFLVPLDADDELAPDYLAELVNALDRHPQAAYAHCWAELFGDQRTLFVTRPFNPYQLLISNPIIGCVVMRREAWAEVGGYDESMTGHEDWELWIRFLKAGWTETVVRRALFRYRKHGVSMSVVSEARFEQERAEIARRHPDLYEFETLKTLKRSWYPWVSIILTPESVAAVSHWEIEDAELVPIGDDYLAAALASQNGWGCQGSVDSVEKAAASARGKFLIVADAVRLLDPGSIARMAEALEERPQALGAGPTGSKKPALWRHWSVVDRSAPHRSLVEVDAAEVVADDGLEAGAFPQPGWDIKDDLEVIRLDLPIQRQPPEEEGRIPEWLR